MVPRPKEAFPPYHFVVIIPDLLYPFSNKVDGVWVRGHRSYDVALARAYRKYGYGHCGYSILFYREFFHFIGSLGLIYLALFIANHFFGGDSALVILLALAAAFLTYQEFVFQRRVYRQPWSKAVADWLVWCVPMAICYFLLV